MVRAGPRYRRLIAATLGDHRASNGALGPRSLRDRDQGLMPNACLIAICTYKRHLQLGRLLSSLTEHDFGSARVRILVVDNEGCGEVRSLVAAIAERADISIDYVEARPPGLVAARNAAFAAAPAD